MPSENPAIGLNVLLVLPNLSGGGAEGAFFRYIAALQKHGHDVELVLLEDKASYAPPTECKVTLISRSLFGASPLGIASSALRLGRWYRKAAAVRPFDLVISTLPTADMAVAQARLPNAHYRIANTLSASLERVAERDRSLAEKRRRSLVALYRQQSLIAVSDGVARDLFSMLGPAARIRTVPNPFDFALIDKLAAMHESDVPATPYILHVGRFAVQKRHDVLFEAYVRSGVGHKLVLLTEPEHELKRLIERHGLAARVIVAGFRANPYPWYRQAAAVILSSDHEGMPNALIEAIACGRPVVSTDCPSGPSELLVGPLAPFLVPRRNPAALGDAIRRCVQSPPKVSAALVTRFSERAFVDRIEALAGRARAGTEDRPGAAP